MDTRVPRESPKSHPLSCTECRRRKQKCNREWPCNHCQSRRIPQLCNFSSKTSSQSSDEILRGTKRASDEHSVAPSYTPEDDVGGVDDASAGLVAWGYMHDDVSFNLGAFDADGFTRTTRYQGPQFADEVKAALLVIPPRSITDLFVQNFLYHVNNFYNCIYPPQFLDEYATWWNQRKNCQPLCPAFTALLLRVMAYSAQYLTTKSIKHIENELGENIATLCYRYHEASWKLGRCFRHGQGGMLHVQALFLSASWYKGESDFTESWHSLSDAIREAQEIGLHKDRLAPKGTSEFDMEMRRRLWCLLCVWDQQISQWLSRPLLIDRRSCEIEAPNLRIDSLGGLPSPFTAIRLQYDICQQFSRMAAADARNIKHVLSVVDKWMSDFPEVYAFDNPDKSYDRQYSYVRMQREYLHAMSYMFKMDPLKPCLTKTNLSDIELDLRSTAVETAIKMAATAKRLFDIMWPESAKSYVVTCAAFDPAALLTSAIMHDTARTLPHRQAALDTISTALEMLYTVSTATKTGGISYGILSRLTATIPELYESRTSKRIKVDKSTDSAATTSGRSVSSTIESTKTPETEISFDSNISYPSFDDFENANFGGLEQIFDFPELNLAPLDSENGLVTFMPLNEAVCSTQVDMSSEGRGQPIIL